VDAGPGLRARRVEAANPGGSGGVSLQDCQTAALYGGSGLEQCGAAPAFSGIQPWLNTRGGEPATPWLRSRARSSLSTSGIIRVSGAPDIYTVATEQPAKDGTVTIRLSPGLAAYSFTFG
jgi:hypothetical protein